MTKGVKETKHIMRKNSPTITTTIVLLFYVHMCLNVHMSTRPYVQMSMAVSMDMTTDIGTYGHVDI
jgi:hypothetical protein